MKLITLAHAISFSTLCDLYRYRQDVVLGEVKQRAMIMLVEEVENTQSLNGLNYEIFFK